VRAGRLLQLVMILQDGRRHTAAALAQQLEVSTRTVMRDLESLSAAGVPVYATRGPDGGFQLLDTFQRTVQSVPPGLTATRGHLRRVRVRLAPTALQLALVNGRPEGWRPRPGAIPAPDRPEWIEGSFRFDSYDTAIRELLAIGPDIEVLLPTELRENMASIGRRIARLHRSPPPAADPS
jgi:predicted DNA-binding transcriptional regulator YafY